jgi:hypothetical protein
MSGIIVENEAHFIVFKLTGIGLTLKWDGQVKDTQSYIQHCFSLHIYSFTGSAVSQHYVE